MRTAKGGEGEENGIVRDVASYLLLRSVYPFSPLSLLKEEEVERKVACVKLASSLDGERFISVATR